MRVLSGWAVAPRRWNVYFALLAAAVVGILVGPALVQSREKPRLNAIDRCAAHGGRTLVASRVTRVYITRDRLGNRRMRSCSVESGKVTKIRAAFGNVTDLVPHYRIAGRYLAFTAINFDSDQPIDPGVILPVTVWDVERGASVARFFAQPQGASAVLSYADSDPGVTDLELTSRGAVAWIASRPPDDDHYFYVQKADATQACSVILDEGRSIDPSSLAISGRRLYWTSGNDARSALLQGSARQPASPGPC